MFVYLITGPSGKRYVGITSKTIAERWRQHVGSAARKESNSALHAAIRKHGESAFSVEQIQSCETWEEACEMEKAAISTYGSFRPAGYNLTLGGEGGLGCERSDETRARLSAAHAAMSESVRAERSRRLAEANARRTPEEQARIAAAIAASKRGKKRPAEVMQKVAASMRGRTHSDDARARMSASHRGFAHSDESREMMSAKAKARSPESMANFLGCRKGAEHSSEARSKMSEAARARREKTAEKMREIWRQRKAAAQAGGAA